MKLRDQNQLVKVGTEDQNKDGIWFRTRVRIGSKVRIKTTVGMGLKDNAQGYHKDIGQ